MALDSSKPLKSYCFGVGSKRQDVHLADIDGDGKADFISVHDNGTVYCWLNGGADGSASGGWIWSPQGQIWSPTVSGIDAGPGVRFADMDGDGKADLVWLSKSGTATVWLNKVTANESETVVNAKWVIANDGRPVALGVGAFRKDVHLADIDGDGRADYLWVHPEDGSVSAWINQIGDEHQKWVQYATKISTGERSASANVLFAHISHKERVDYVLVNPDNGEIRVWTSSCDLTPLPDFPPVDGCSDGSQTGTLAGVNTPSTPTVGATTPSTLTVGVTTPSTLTVGIPQVPSGSLPTCGPSTTRDLVSLASQVTQLFTVSQQVVLSLSRSAACTKLSLFKDTFSNTYNAFAPLASKANQTDTSCLQGFNLLFVQDLRTELPSLVAEMPVALTELFGPCSSPNSTPDDSAIQSVEHIFGSTGGVGQLIRLLLEPLISQSGSGGAGGSSDEGGSNGQKGLPATLILTAAEVLTTTRVLTATGVPMASNV